LEENKKLRMYRIQRREDYLKYKKLSTKLKELCGLLAKLDVTDAVRTQITEQLLEKLYNVGLASDKKSLANAAKIFADHFCRRRLAVVLVRNQFCESIKTATTFIEQGHVRIGPQVVTDPAMLVTRSMEDYISWVDESKIKQKILRYNNMLDDFDLIK